MSILLALLAGLGLLVGLVYAATAWAIDRDQHPDDAEYADALVWRDQRP